MDFRTSWVWCGIGIGTVLAAGAPALAQEAVEVAPPETAQQEAAPSAGTATRVGETPAAERPPLTYTPQQTEDAESIRRADGMLIRAYDQADPDGVAALFTDDAEFVDEHGHVFHGKQAIREAMAAFFKENPRCQLALEIDSLRFVGPGVAVEEGRAMVVRPDDSEAMETNYTTVHVNAGGTWLMASVRDHAPAHRAEHRSRLHQLDWLIGDWVDEGEEMLVSFSCTPVDDGNFLLRKFSVQVGGQETMTGTQRIGWDPATGKLRSWIFDSRGGFAEGTWHQDGDSWVLASSGVTSDGKHATGMSIYTPVNDNVMIWQAVNHEIGGVRQPDSEQVTIIRRAPRPGSQTQSLSENR